MVTAGDERGQLILIGALLVAATILGSIVLLNTIHESPQVSTQQDSQSLVETERTVDQVQTGLERAFLTNTSMDERGEALPYAEKSGGFGTLVEDEYVTEYLNLSTTDTAGVVDVTLVGNQTGGIARQNRTIAGFQPYPSGEILADAEAIPRLHLLVNETSASSFTVWINETSGTPPNEMRMEINGSGVFKRGSNPDTHWTCDLSGDNSQLEIDFINGVGEVRTDEVYCGDLTFGESLSPDYTIEFKNGNKVDGEFTITGVGSSVSSPVPALDADPTDGRWFKQGSDIVVNPIFEIEYLTPNVTYNATYAPYNRTAP